MNKNELLLKNTDIPSIHVIQAEWAVSEHKIANNKASRLTYWEFQQKYSNYQTPHKLEGKHTLWKSKLSVN
jgi:hypothetical protein